MCFFQKDCLWWLVLITHWFFGLYLGARMHQYNISQFFPYLVITVEENIKFVQSDQNRVIWHLELSLNWTLTGTLLLLPLNVWIHLNLGCMRRQVVEIIPSFIFHNIFLLRLSFLYFGAFSNLIPILLLLRQFSKMEIWRFKI